MAALRTILMLLLIGASIGGMHLAASAAARVAAPTRQAESAADVTGSRQLAEARRHNEILEMKNGLQEQAYARFELIMAGLGALITVLVLGFGIFTYRTAVSAARQELADLKDKVQKLHDDAAEARQRAIEAAELAKGAAEGAQVHQQSAKEAASEIVREAARLAERHLSPGLPDAKGPMLSPAEQETVSDAAREVEIKPSREWTAEEFRVKILQAHTNREWAEVLRLAWGMEFVHEDDEEALAFALFQQALALERLKRLEEACVAFREVVTRLSHIQRPSVQEMVSLALYNHGACLTAMNHSEEAIAVYDDVISRFGEATEPRLRQHVADALYNKGIALGRLDRSEEAIAAYNQVISRFEDDAAPALQVTVALAMVNKGYRLAVLRRFKEAIAAGEQVIRRFGRSQRDDLRQRVAMALLNMAGVYALQGKVEPCIARLEAWKAHVGCFDCRTVFNEKEFEGLRDNPEFVAYLSKQGCPDWPLASAASPATA